MKKIHSAGIIVYHDNQGLREYLLLQYPAGHWEFPKGKLEKGETNEQAALRELKEETGLDVVLHHNFCESLTYFFKSFDGKTVEKTVDFFIGQSDTKEVIVSHEHIGYVWLPYQKALEQLTYDNAKQIFMRAVASMGM